MTTKKKNTSGSNQIPKQIVVSPFVYKVVEEESLSQYNTDQDTEMIGRCCTETLTIHIKSGLPILNQKETTLHESLHALFSNAGLGSAVGYTEESLIAALAPRLYEFIVNNPKLIAFLSQE